MNFSIAHFTIFSETDREDLHGHNFQVECEVTAPLYDDGLMFDYAVLKKILKAQCDALDEKTVLPEKSPHLKLEESDGYIIGVFNGERLPFLPRDVITLPIANTTVEEFSHYLLHKILEESDLKERGVKSITVRVSSSPGQRGIATEEL